MITFMMRSCYTDYIPRCFESRCNYRWHNELGAAQSSSHQQYFNRGSGVDKLRSSYVSACVCKLRCIIIYYNVMTTTTVTVMPLRVHRSLNSPQTRFVEGFKGLLTARQPSRAYPYTSYVISAYGIVEVDRCVHIVFCRSRYESIISSAAVKRVYIVEGMFYLSNNNDVWGV